MRDGLLSKRAVRATGGVLNPKTWKQRRIKLHASDPPVMSWSDPKSDELLGELAFDLKTTVARLEDKVHAFSVTAGRDSLNLNTASDAERDAWMHAIRGQIERMHARETRISTNAKRISTLETEVKELEGKLRVAQDQLRGEWGDSTEATERLTALVADFEKTLSRAHGSAEAAFAPITRLLATKKPLPPPVEMERLVATDMVFGDDGEFLGGFQKIIQESCDNAELFRSMRQEAEAAKGGPPLGGTWKQEFEYVVTQKAEEDVNLPSTAKFKGKYDERGVPIIRDQGHAGWTLKRFCEEPEAKEAELNPAEVAALRLYTGPMYQPINAALRKRSVSDWATTISFCYSAVLKLSRLTSKDRFPRVYRGIDESELKLPPSFLDGDFLGYGIERAFMSTSAKESVALQYSGGPGVEGAIFVIDFAIGARGAAVQWLSQYPHEQELLFPPCTALTCVDHHSREKKRCILVSAQVSTNRNDAHKDFPGPDPPEPSTKPMTEEDRRRKHAAQAKAKPSAERRKPWFSPRGKAPTRSETGKAKELDHALGMAEKLMEVAEDLGLYAAGDESDLSSVTSKARFTSEMRELVMGRAQDAALGLSHFLKIDEAALYSRMMDGTTAIEGEFAQGASLESQECLHYVLHERAGSSPKMFGNSPYPRDCDASGLRSDRKTASGEGMTIRDFVQHPIARLAALSEAHVVALRLFSTEAFKDMQIPLRRLLVEQTTEPHPLAATVFLLSEAIKRLRAVGAQETMAMENLDLFRGMRNVKLSDEFMMNGGTEVSVLSTTSDLGIALQYCFGDGSMIFKVKTSSFMERGVDITFCSAFPHESEMLYPPLTYLRPTGKIETAQLGTSTITIVEVTPQFGS